MAETPTTWTDEQFGLVSSALLYPAARVAVVRSGYSPSVEWAWALDAQLTVLGEATKAESLQMAQEIKNAERQLMKQALGGCGGSSDLGITRVGDIQMDPRQAVALTRELIARYRALLSALVDFPVNPASDLAGGMGGINGRCA